MTIANTIYGKRESSLLKEGHKEKHQGTHKKSSMATKGENVKPSKRKPVNYFSPFDGNNLAMNMSPQLPLSFEVSQSQKSSFHLWILATSLVHEIASLMGVKSMDPPMLLTSCRENAAYTRQSCSRIMKLTMRHLLRQQQRILLAKSDVAGRGAFLKNLANKNDYLGEYTGELISHRESDICGKIYDRANSSFFFDLNDHYILDAYRKETS